MAKKKAVMEDPKAAATPELCYGDCRLTVGVDEERIRVEVDLALPEATPARVLNQDLLAAAKITDEAEKFLKARHEFFKDQIRVRLGTKKCKQAAGFLEATLVPPNQKDFSWKDYATSLLVERFKVAGQNDEMSLLLAQATAQKAYDAAPIKDCEDRVMVNGVKGR